MYGKVLICGSNAVATEHPLASLAGYETIRSGGNAFDAAATVALALSVVLPQLSGLGGDFFALIREKDGKRVQCINSSGWSPSGATVENVQALGIERMPAQGPNGVVIPGFVRGVCEMHKRLGRLELNRILDVPIELAVDGFPVSPSLSNAIAKAQSTFSPAAREVFLRAGQPLTVGSILRQPSLGRTLGEVASRGPDGFYSGGAGDEVRDAIAAGGIQVNSGDLTSFTPEWVEPLRLEYRGHDVFEVPPNSMGATSLLILKLLEEEDGPDRSTPSVKPNSKERVQRMIQAARVAYSARDEKIADPRFVRFDLNEFLEATARSAGPAATSLEKADTTYFAICDEEGNLLSCVQSLYHHFGSKVYLKDSGFFLNSRASAFRLAGPNKLEPRKRPLHTLSSLMISRKEKNGEESSRIALGTSGGDYRPQQHALLVTNLIDYSMTLEEAINFPRFLWDGKDTMMVEDGYELGGMEPVRKLGYPGPTGVAQGIECFLQTDVKTAVCDLRGDGLPVGN